MQTTIADDTITNDELLYDELIAKQDSDSVAFDGQDDVLGQVEEGSGDLTANAPEKKFSNVGLDENEETESQCQQVTSAEGVSIDCKGLKLEAVLNVLDSSVAVLDLSNNAISELTSTAFPEKLDNLKQLSLKNNAIKSIDKNVS